MPEPYINMEETKVDDLGKGRKVTWYRCWCAVCEKCWYSPEVGYCLYGGPYSGYEEVKDE